MLKRWCCLWLIAIAPLTSRKQRFCPFWKLNFQLQLWYKRLSGLVCVWRSKFAQNENTIFKKNSLKIQDGYQKTQNFFRIRKFQKCTKSYLARGQKLLVAMESKVFPSLFLFITFCTYNLKYIALSIVKMIKCSAQAF